MEKFQAVCAMFIQCKDVVGTVASPRGGLGWTCPPPLLLEVASEIDTNPTSFCRGRGRRGSVRSAPPPDPRYTVYTGCIGSRSALAMSVHPTYFDLATPLCRQGNCLALGVQQRRKRNLLSAKFSIIASCATHNKLVGRC